MSQPELSLLTGSVQVELRALISSSRQRLTGEVNAELPRLYWALVNGEDDE